MRGYVGGRQSVAGLRGFSLSARADAGRVGRRDSAWCYTERAMVSTVRHHAEWQRGPAGARVTGVAGDRYVPPVP